MDEQLTFEAILEHDGTVRTVSLPRSGTAQPPPRIRAQTRDGAGNTVVDVFVLVGQDQWPAQATYRYLGSIPVA